MAWDGHTHSGLQGGMQATIPEEGLGWDADGARAWLQAGRGG